MCWCCFSGSAGFPRKMLSLYVITGPWKWYTPPPSTPTQHSLITHIQTSILPWWVSKTGIEGLSQAKFLIWAGASLSEFPPLFLHTHKNVSFLLINGPGFYSSWGWVVLTCNMALRTSCISVWASPHHGMDQGREGTLSFPISLNLIQAEPGGLRVRLVVQQST